MRGKLDQEWVDLILRAKAIGLETDEIRNFLKENRQQKNEFVCQQAEQWN